MSSDLNREIQALQAVRCGDCRHDYAVSRNLKSARCPVCGNIEYLTLERRARTRDAKLEAQLQKELPLKFLAPEEMKQLSDAADPKIVDALQRRFPEEWELWSMVVRNFHDANFHQAYISQCAHRLLLGKASGRYLQHQAIMGRQSEFVWQARMAELMLQRISALCLAQGEHFLRNSGAGLPKVDWSWHSVRFVAFLAGGALVAWILRF